MPDSRLHPVCRACHRSLPRAASRCPWCKFPATVRFENPWSARGPRTMHPPRSRGL